MAATHSSWRPTAALVLGLAFLLLTVLLPTQPSSYSTRLVEATEVEADACYQRGVSALVDQDYDQAVLHLSKAIKTYSKLASSSWGEMMAPVWKSIESRRGSVSKSEMDSLFHESWRYRDKFVQAITKRGDAYSKKGQFQEAIADYTEAIRLDQDTETYRRRATAYRAVGDRAKAELDERQAEFQSKMKLPEKPFPSAVNEPPPPPTR
jgi:tetratricopeptide (TPR) repeat protein